MILAYKFFIRTTFHKYEILHFADIVNLSWTFSFKNVILVLSHALERADMIYILSVSVVHSLPMLPKLGY